MGKIKVAVEALVAAVSNGRLAEAERLLAAGIDVNQKIDGMSALHFVVTSRSSIPGFRWLVEKARPWMNLIAMA
jgi:hypothetical protein